MRIIIIGAGLLGIASGYFLAKSGHIVEIFDRENGPGLDTSFANAGMLTPSMADPWNAPGIWGQIFSMMGHRDSPFILRPKALPSLIGWGLTFLRNSRKDLFLKNMWNNAVLANYSLKVMEKLRSDLSIQYDKNDNGSIKVFRDQKSMDKIVTLSRHLDQHQIEYHIMNREAILKVEPALTAISDQLCGGIYFPNDESGDAYQFCRGLAEATKKAGGKFHFGSTVNKLVKKNGHISKIITDNGEFEADTFILSAGSYSSLLAKDIGLKIPVRPVKGYSLTVPVNDWKEGPQIPVVDDGFHAAITPLGNILRVAGTAEFAGYDTSLDKNRLENLYALLNEIYPELTPHFAREEVEEWAGLRPMSANGVPLIGKTNIPNLYLNTGHGHLGWSMMAGAGKLLSDIISGIPPEIDQAPYELSRH